MSSPHVIEYLRTHTLTQLYDNHGVKFRIDKDRTKICLNYDQLKVRSGDPVAECCRGLIIRPDFVGKSGSKLHYDDDVIAMMNLGLCHVVCRPMDRFYNQGDSAAATIDNKSMTVFEKLDGTMCALYFDRLKGQWHVSTRSIPESDLPIRAGDIVLNDKTFADLFWEAFDETLSRVNLERQDALDDMMFGYTYIFELTTPQNRVVVQYDEKRVTLLAVRHNRSGRELKVNLDARVRHMHFPVPRTWDLNDGLAVAAFADSFSPSQLEGFVIVDDKFNRVKVKNSKWVLSSKAKNGVVSSKRNALMAAFKGTIDDVIPMVDPESQTYLGKVRDGVRNFVSQQEEIYTKLAAQVSPGDYKAFALLVNAASRAKEIPLVAPFFMTFRGRVNSVLDYFENAAAEDKFTDKSLDIILKHLSL